MSDSYILDYAGNKYYTCGLMKTDKISGQVLWGKKITIPDNNYYIIGNGILKTENGLQLLAKIYPFGTSQSFTKASTFINLNFSGNLINIFRVNNINTSGDFISTADNKTICMGTDNLGDPAFLNTFLYQVDNHWGTFDWGRRYKLPIGVTTSTWKPSLIQTSDKEIVTVVNRRDPVVINRSLNTILKLDATGNSGGCPDSSFTAAIDYPQISMHDIYVTGQDIDMAAENISFSLNDEMLAINPICFATSHCDLLKLSRTDTVCSFKDSINYSIKRNPDCNTIPFWKLSDTSFGSISILNDS